MNSHILHCSPNSINILDVCNIYLLNFHHVTVKINSSNGVAAEVPVRPETLARAGTSLEDQSQQLIMDKLWKFATTRSLRYRIFNDADVVISGKQERDGSFGVGEFFTIYNR